MLNENFIVPLIFDVQHGSTADGPGIRTTVFLKGCNLNCYWCHNPEGKSPLKQLAFFKEKCIGCNLCKEVCKNPNGCIECGQCVEFCVREAKKSYGRFYSEKELFDLIYADRIFYNATGGGVTFSGGECMLYADYVAKVAKKCKEANISVAIDTAGNVPYESFEKILPYVDLFLYDIKAIDKDLHKKGTGKENILILENFKNLVKEGKRVIVRTPVIPNFNDGEELQKIKDFCKAYGVEHQLLEYHTTGKTKEEALLSFAKV